MNNIKIVVLIGLILLAGIGQTLAVWITEIKDIGRLGGPWSEGLAANNVGQVVGWSAATTGNHAFIWTEQGGMVDLGGLVGPNTLTSRALDINDLGQVVGESFTCVNVPPSCPNHASLWTQDGGMIDLGNLGSSSFAEAINSSGAVVGHSYLGIPATPWIGHAFIWTQQGGMKDIGTLGGQDDSRANDINDLGQVVGVTTIPSGKSHAFVWTSQDGMKDIGTLGGDYSEAFSINNAGDIVGYSTTASGVYHATLWKEGGIVDLGSLGGSMSYALGINDLGQVVGYDAEKQRGFLWTEQDGMKDIGTLGGDYSRAESINNLGRIAGSSVPYSKPYTNATVWTVSSNPPTPKQEIQQITNAVQSLESSGTLSSGQGKALMAKLDAITQKLDNGNKIAACNILKSFLNEVQAYIKSGELTTSQGQVLIDKTNLAINQNGC